MSTTRLPQDSEAKTFAQTSLKSEYDGRVIPAQLTVGVESGTGGRTQKGVNDEKRSDGEALRLRRREPSNVSK